MTFSDFSAWNFFVQLGIIFVGVLLGNIIRRKVKFIRNSLVPSSVIAGIIIFTLKFIPVIGDYIDSRFMEMITYHALGLGFIALGLKSETKTKDKQKLVVLDTGLITVNTYLIQGIIGLIITILLAVTFMKELFPAAGLLLPMGFGQGTGQALNIGNVFKTFGFTNGPSFGLSIAAIGFLVACLIGVFYLNYLRKKGELSIVDERKKDTLSHESIYTEDEAPLNESIDKLTIQIGLVSAVYLFTYLVIFGLSFLSENYLGKFGVNTVKPLLWGFNFLFGSLFAILAKIIIKKLRTYKLMTHNYVNNYMMNRLSGMFFDVMIVAGIAAIDWQNLSGLMLPLLLVCLLGGAGTFLYVRFACNKIYPEYKHEAFFSMFGMLTGTASTGMILLREIDPEFETPAASNLVLQQLPAIIFGSPLLLLLTFAAQSLTNTVIMLGIIIGLFVTYNLILLRKEIFKKKI
jgi:ESS family glutamate:Na+ symporter